MTRNSIAHSISVASRLSGVPIETLRAWERRYGFPQPDRTGTNRRLYSEGDIARLRAITRALAQGFRAGDVVRRGRDEIEALLGDVVVAPSPVGFASSQLTTVAGLVDLLASDDIEAFDVELRRLAGALGPRAFVVDVAHPLAVAVGEAWQSGRVEVRQEHYASEALATQLRLMLGSLQDVPGSPTVVLATLPGESHGLGLVMVALYLAVSGAKPRIVGVSTPVDQLAAAASALRAEVIGLTITPASLGMELERQLRALELGLPRGARLWLGGQGAQRVARTRRRTVVSDWLSLDAAIEHARVPGRTP